MWLADSSDNEPGAILIGLVFFSRICPCLVTKIYYCETGKRGNNFDFRQLQMIVSVMPASVIIRVLIEYRKQKLLKFHAAFWVRVRCISIEWSTEKDRQVRQKFKDRIRFNRKFRL